MDPIPWLVKALLQYELRQSFRRVLWVGDWPPSLPDEPVIAYANHHHYYDGHLSWLLFRKRLERPATLWMAEWDRFPFFGAVGAQPFPPNDPSRRTATLRRTARRFHDRPRTVLVYYPGGELTPPEAGIPSFDSTALTRLADLYPDAHWWPLAIHVTWRGAARPTAFLSGGPAHQADGNEHQRLVDRWSSLKSPDPGPHHPLLNGTNSASDRWGFFAAASFFERYL